MPVATHPKLRGKIARAGQVWTEELTQDRASAVGVAFFFADPYGPSGRNPARTAIWGAE